jgi:RNA polymerase sigma-70 factor (ECF subfamily)
MSDSSGSSSYDPDELFARARAGDQEAWAQLFDHCYDKVRRVVRRRLDRPMRSLFDSTDFANDVFKSLVAKSDRFDFPNMAALRAYLEQAARQKLIDEYRRQHRQKRDRSREHRLLEDDEGGTLEPPASGPTPSQFAVERETRETLLAGQSGADRRIIELKDQGYSNEEVAEQTGLHVRKVQRRLKKVLDSWFLRGGKRP